jgi:hypothetical protein
MASKRVIVICEFSGIVRDAFIRKGHEAMSCDLLPTEVPGPHIQADATTLDLSSYDLAICHPPCTYLTIAANRYWGDPDWRERQERALNFVRWCLSLPMAVCVENPVGAIGTHIRKADQIIHPWMFGVGEKKQTCLWLKGLPKLESTVVSGGDYSRLLALSPSDERWKDRSRTYVAIAEAMASQWGR